MKWNISNLIHLIQIVTVICASKVSKSVNWNVKYVWIEITSERAKNIILSNIIQNIVTFNKNIIKEYVIVTSITYLTNLQLNDVARGLTF